MRTPLVAVAAFLAAAGFLALVERLAATTGLRWAAGFLATANFFAAPALLIPFAAGFLAEDAALRALDAERADLLDAIETERADFPDACDADRFNVCPCAMSSEFWGQLTSSLQWRLVVLWVTVRCTVQVGNARNERWNCTKF